MKRFFALTLVLQVGMAYALEVDEKLTLRVVKLSESRKTMLINRGSEDGLKEGDHAKFYVSAGVVARGMVVKLSPSRSVWSIYRLVNADFVVADAVMSLKITPPVKVTQDESRMIVQEDIPTKVDMEDPANLGIPLAEGANDLPQGATEMNSQADLNALEMQLPSSLKEKNLELWSALSISSLGSKTSADADGVDDYSGSQGHMQLSLVGEYYFKEEREWWSRVSPYALVNFHNRGSMAFQGSRQEETSTEFGAGFNIHPGLMPSTVNRFIPFIGLSIAMGSVRSTYQSGSETNSDETIEAQGSSLSYSFGGGFKFYTASGWGARAILDYYFRSDKMKEDSVTWTRDISGPRLWVGIGYRW